MWHRSTLLHGLRRTRAASRLFTRWLLISGCGLSLLLYLMNSSFTAMQAQTIPPVTPTLVSFDPTITPTETPLSPGTTEPAAGEPTATATPTLPPVAQATATPQPHLLISELLADPKAVSDEQGEWIELYNAGGATVNLQGWRLADLGNDSHTISSDLFIAAGQYLVLARQGDSSRNGGVAASYVYTNLALANSSDELLLFTADGLEMDRVRWGEGTAVTSQSGASLQRASINGVDQWVTSSEPWPGSAGDSGSPSSGYRAPVATTTPDPATTPAATPTTGNQWSIAQSPSLLQIEEIYYSGSDDEFVALVNTAAEPLDLTGWVIGDEETIGQGEGMYSLPTDYRLAPGDRFLIARDPLAFQQRWGSAPNGAFDGDNPALRLQRRRELATGEWALNNSGDEVVLLSPSGELADAVAFVGGSYGALGLAGTLQAPQGYSLHRVPGPQFPTERELRHRFLYAPPDPFGTITQPLAQPNEAVPLAAGLVALWGSLGAQSNFSADGSAPPHYLLAAAAAQGLNYLAIADETVSWPWQLGQTVHLPAWRWGDSSGGSAIIYSEQQATITDQNALLAWLAGQNRPGAWLDTKAPSSALAAFRGDGITAPGDLPALAKAWATVGAPLLPAGNTNPTLPSAINPNPRYTGLAVATVDQAGLLAAISTHRGWLTNRPGLWLTLQATTSSGERQWMGTVMTPGNSVTLDITYGDRQGEVAGLTLWQNGAPLRQLDLPVGNHTWQVTVPALPDTFLFAVATQADGDFAVTAPLQVTSARGGSVLLNEVLPAPWDDLNNDGTVSTDDEFIELYNPSPYPLSLVGWQLVDAAGDGVDGRRYTFKAGQFINGGGWLRLFRAESKISLNNEQEYVRLLNPAGTEVDRVAWAVNPARGASLSRLPDGGRWGEGDSSPGRANGRFTGRRLNETPAPTPTPRPTVDEREDDYLTPTPVRLPPTYGQAGGPPGSIAQSKLAGLDAWVEFRGVVTAPPGLFNASIYVADPVPDPRNGPLAGIGINVYLRDGLYPALQEGDWVRVQGQLRSFRGEMELWLASPNEIWLLEQGTPLQPLPVTVADIGESLEGRLVTLSGTVSGWQGDSIFLVDPNRPGATAVQVTVRSSTGWRRPYVNKGQRWQATGIVSQFARASPWNGGYRILVRWERDLVKVKAPTP